MSQTIIVPGGSPVVGSQTIDGDTFFTQQHELTLFTQRDGEIEIPPFKVRFSGKKTFTSDPEPMEGSTAKLSFQSKRPPGTETMGFVVAASKLEATQTWTPDSNSPLSAGDVIQRTITRRASGTSAMMLAPIAIAATEGIRIYASDPLVNDNRDRGVTSAERSDTIKYQFEHAGTFDIPDVTIVWWDTTASELRRDIMKGSSVNVSGVNPSTNEANEPETQTRSAMYVLTIALTVCLISAVAWILVIRWRARFNSPEALASRRLTSACRSNDPNQAYSTLIAWKRIVTAGGENARLESLIEGDFERESEILTERMFASQSQQGSWKGARLAAAFSETRRKLNRSTQFHETHDDLPALNPPGPNLSPR